MSLSELPVAARPVRLVASRHAVDIGERRVILDLERDRYFMSSSHAATPCDREAACQFGYGLDLPTPVGEVRSDGQWAVAPALDAYRALHRVQALMNQSFRTLMTDVSAEPTSCDVGRSVQDLLASFEAVRPWFSAGRVCRLDAPALCLLLRRHGHPARLVLGVRLDPFGAHCWAQLGETTVNEPTETVLPFAPLMAV